MGVGERLIISGPENTAGPRITTDVVLLTTAGTKLVIEAVLLVIVVSLWTFLRIWSRRLMRVPLATEDWFHVVSLIFFYGLAVSMILVAVTGGAGHHVYMLQPWHTVRYSEIVFSIEFLYAFSVGFAKISITLMIMRIFIHRHVRIAGICIIVLSTGWMLHPLFTGLLLCTPIEANWNPAIPGAHCDNQYVGFGVVAGIDIINELALLILPIPSLWRVYLNTRYKFALLGVFGTGLVTLIITAIRIPILLETNFYDLTFDTRNQQIILAEPAAALIVSCSPILKPVFDKAISRIMRGAQRDPTTTSDRNGSERVRSRSHKIISSHRYTSVGDSQEFIELGVVAPPSGDHQTNIFAATHPTKDGPGELQNNTSS
ncbi:hypothetical protein GQX73_g9631 [Xylaria multiplex]|uniref:Rhodopsin domain-containing protein n=1 Tax=Xylaria multiplex TaxID=323545 RepID=A0A7C8IKP7_9PEZI|nr:hypothetical protein GQX73_g9631 [Xylaria multiplex]